MLVVYPMLMVLICMALASEARAIPTEISQPEKPEDYVVVVHGLGRTALSMKRLEHYLKNHGYRVVNVSYPSTRFSVEQLSDNFLRRLLEKQTPNPAARIHFVTHSMGGILVRQYLSNHSLTNLRRVVMLAPPNQGSEIIDHLKASPLKRNLLGPARFELGTGENDLPKRLGPVHFQCGVIAGDRSLNPFLSSLLPGPNDGKVAVESARIEGMQDFLVLHSTHTWLMWRKWTLHQTVRFLESGHFDREISIGAKNNRF
jgi:pimeloyl-ACP methyl ester carboxylesterase